MKELMTDYFENRNQSRTEGPFRYLQKMAKRRLRLGRTADEYRRSDPALDGCVNGDNKYYMNGATLLR